MVFIKILGATFCAILKLLIVKGESILLKTEDMALIKKASLNAGPDMMLLLPTTRIEQIKGHDAYYVTLDIRKNPILEFSPIGIEYEDVVLFFSRSIVVKCWIKDLYRGNPRLGKFSSHENYDKIEDITTENLKDKLLVFFEDYVKLVLSKSKISK